jgi:hypothetical protein
MVDGNTVDSQVQMEVLARVTITNVILIPHVIFLVVLNLHSASRWCTMLL